MTLKVEMKDTGRRDRKVYSAQEKCQAVLSMWTQNRKPGSITKELGISWTLLNHWQQVAMQGMLTALSPRLESEEKSSILPPKLQKLLETQLLKKQTKLEKRLQKLQEAVKPQKE